MTDTSDYSGVTEKDFEGLNNLYLSFVQDTHIHLQEYPELKALIDSFIKKSGEATKALLLKYRQSEYVAKLGEKDWREQHQAIKHKNVKLNLAANELVKAAKKFSTIMKEK